MWNQLRSWWSRPLARRRSQYSPGVEGLEPRQMLTGDLVISQVNFNFITPTQMSYTATIGNIGNQSIIVDDVTLQGYLSTDNILNGGDLGAGGVSININLLPNTAQLKSFSPSHTIENYLSHSYLLLVIDSANVVNEANENNNVIAVELPSLPVTTPSEGVTAGKSGKYVFVDPSIQFSNADNGTFQGTIFTVTSNSDFVDFDTLTVRKLKTDDGVIKLVKGQLRLGKTVIGTVEGGGPGGTELEITMTAADLNANQLSHVLRAVSLKSQKKTAGPRTVTIQTRLPTNIIGLDAHKDLNLS